MKLCASVSTVILMAVSGIAVVPATHADPYYYPGDPKQYGEAHYQVICNSVGQEPNPHGIWATVSVLLSQERNLDYKKMQSAVAWAINRHCPQFDAAYSQYRADYP